MSTLTEEKPGITWEQFHAAADLCAAEDKGEWAGAPRLCQTVPLVLEPRYPYQGFNGKCLETLGTERPDAERPEARYRVANRWWDDSHCRNVTLVHDAADGKAHYFWEQDEGYPHRWDALMHGFEPAMMMDIHAESRAIRTLQELLTPTAFRYYFLLGYFLESSTRSGLMYCFRKLRPTIAMTPRPHERMRILTTLCLHPIGYYEGTHVGAMVPTDDVIAHLLMMRGDEHKFWSKANHHPPHSWQAGI